jgi:protein-L-isoaspartate(D-aspartate) O-methyltransferase
MARILGVICMLALGGCGRDPAPAAVVPPRDYAAERLRMVHTQISSRGVSNPRVLEAMAKVPRHEFVPEAQRKWAYEDGPLPIGQGQTISQPFIVAFMTAALNPKPTDRVLEIGTGSGYQAAVLACLVAEVWSIEILEAIGRRAEGDLARLGYRNVKVRIRDGFLGWPEAAPFDSIIVTCAPDQVPQALVEQLKVGGRMVIPVGPHFGNQELLVLLKTQKGLEQHEVLPVRFVPMVKGK